MDISQQTLANSFRTSVTACGGGGVKIRRLAVVGDVVAGDREDWGGGCGGGVPQKKSCCYIKTSGLFFLAK